jgi:N-hydroxyarylamine O-acetyltransferase
MLQGITNQFKDAPPTLETLTKIHSYLNLKYPYENYSVYRGTRKPTLDHELLIKKLTKNDNRGGYCVELNEFYFLILKELNFKVTRHSARVLRNLIDTHMLLLVEIDQDRYICDIGVSEYASSTPLLVENNQLCNGSGGKRVRLVESIVDGKNGYIYQVKDLHKNEIDFANFYFFEDIEYSLEHFIQINDYVQIPSHCPPPPFNVEFITKALEDGGRIQLIGDSNGYSFYRRDFDGKELHREKITNEGVPKLVLEWFKIDLGSI